VAASLLNAVGMPELITKSVSEYEALALDLASHPEKLSALKVKLAQNKLSQPLFDTARTTRNIEAAYQQMVERHFQGLPPAPIDVTD
jgi:predicted O-linked N-acetylglucosamine transferase (SPINDLY family)